MPVLRRAPDGAVQHPRRDAAAVGGEPGDVGPGVQVRRPDQQATPLERAHDIGEAAHRFARPRARVPTAAGLTGSANSGAVAPVAAPAPAPRPGWPAGPPR